MDILKMEDIQKYSNYLNELKLAVEKGEKHVTSKLIMKHGVAQNTNSCAQQAGVLQIFGRGLSTTYKFKVSTIEPYHVRKVIDYVYGISLDANKSIEKTENIIQDNEPVKTKIKGSSETTISKYVTFFTTLHALVSTGVKYNLEAVIEQHKITKSVMKYAVSSGLCIRGADGKYIFTKKVNRTNILALLKDLNADQNKNMREVRKTVVIKSAQNNNKRATHAETVYRIFGIKFMTSKTKYFSE